MLRVVHTGFQSVKCLTQQRGGRVNGFWHPDRWADVLHYAGKTKGQGQEFRWMSESPRCLKRGAIIIIILLHSAL